MVISSGGLHLGAPAVSNAALEEAVQARCRVAGGIGEDAALHCLAHEDAASPAASASSQAGTWETLVRM